MRSWMITAPVGWMVLAVVLPLARAAEPESAAPDPAEESRLASENAAAEFVRMAGRTQGEEGGALVPVEASVLHWTNPDVGRVYGDVFLWTLDGRPEALVSIYQYFHPYQSVTAEFSSLSAGRVDVRREGKSMWAPTSPGVEWRPLPGGPPPADRELSRLRQMRTLAGRFEAVLTDRRDEQERGRGIPKRLRLLTTPVYRYEPSSRAALDGALFTFVVGTDPELFLLLEVPRTDAKPGWRYALARMNHDRMQVRLDRELIWETENVFDRLPDTSFPYCHVDLTP